MSVEGIERELAKLRMNEDGTIGLRSSVLNLIVVSSEERAPEVTRAISSLAGSHPSRAIVLISDPEGEENFDVGLSVFCGVRGGVERDVCSEQITVHAEGPPALHLESVAGPLLIPDLPTYLFYPGEFSAASPEFTRMAGLADHIILDSSSASGCVSAFREVANVLDDPEMPPVGDLQWATLSPWRALARELFASPERAAELRKVRSVEVLHAPDGECRALLFAGWLSAVLGWEPKGATPSENGRRFVFDGPSGEVSLALSPSLAGAFLSRISLRSEDCAFEISRLKDAEEVRVSVKRDNEAVGESAARLGSFDVGAMLGEELKRRGRVRAYEASLKKISEALGL